MGRLIGDDFGTVFGYAEFGYRQGLGGVCRELGGHGSWWLSVGGGWETSINGVPGRFRVHWVHIPVQVVINAIHVRIICAFLRNYCFAAHQTQDDAELGCIRGRNK